MFLHLKTKFLPELKKEFGHILNLSKNLPLVQICSDLLVCSVSRRKQKIMTDQMSVCSGRRRSAWAEGSHLTCIRRGGGPPPNCARTSYATTCSRASDYNFRTLAVHLLLWMYLAVLLLWAYAMTAVSSPRSTARLPYWDAWVARGRYYTSPPPGHCNPFANHQGGAV